MILAVETQIDMDEVAEQAERDAQWIISNTKPCPQCNGPIQKNEGCNHMTCRNVGLARYHVPYVTQSEKKALIKKMIFFSDWYNYSKTCFERPIFQKA